MQQEISSTHQRDGGFDPTIFLGAAEVFRTVAQDTVLGDENIGKRKRGTTAEDVASAIAEGLEQRSSKKRNKQGEEVQQHNGEGESGWGFVAASSSSSFIDQGFDEMKKRREEDEEKKKEGERKRREDEEKRYYEERSRGYYH